MKHPPQFDPNVYFGIVAQNLLNIFGETALEYAIRAQRRMAEIDDHDGLELWQGIERQMVAQFTPRMAPASVTLH